MAKNKLLKLAGVDVKKDVFTLDSAEAVQLKWNENQQICRIMLTDDDAKEWQRFWEESVSMANDEVKDMLVKSSAIADDYNVELEVSRFFDTNLLPSIVASLRSYFISSIVSKWYMFCNKGEAQTYAAEALAMLTDAMRKLYSRKRPPRPNRK